MEPEKTVGLSFRITPRMKRLLEAAAANERRSLTNTLEILVEELSIVDERIRVPSELDDGVRLA